MSDLAQAAEVYAKRGWKIFPLLPNTKQPFPGSEGFKDATSEWTAKTWPAGANIGFVPASAGMVCIDLDPGHDENVAAALLPETMEVETPHGTHCYYLTDKLFSNARLAAHIDVRSANGYTLLPPSMVDGQSYAWIDAQAKAARLPQDVASRISEIGESRRKRTEASAGVDTPANINRGRRALQETDPTSDGWSIAVMLRRDMGLSEHMSIELFDEWSQKQAWPWGYDKIESLVVNAGRYGRDEGSQVDSSAYPTPDEGATKTYRGRWPTRISPQDAANRPKLSYWDQQGTMPKVPGGAILVVSAPQSNHKTGLVLKKCLDACEQGARVLYIAAEGGYGIDTARLPAARQQRSMPWETLNAGWWTFTANLNLAIDIPALIEHVGDFKPDIVVFDTLTRTAGAADLNTAQAVQTIYGELDQLMLAWGSLVILVHHPKKGPDAKGAAGSAQIENSAYATWHLKRADDLLECWVDKMKDGRAEFNVTYKVDMTMGPPVIVDTDRSRAHSPAFLEVMAILATITGTASLQDIVDALEPDPSRKANAFERIRRQVQRAPKEFEPIMTGGADLMPKAWLFIGQKPE